MEDRVPPLHIQLQLQSQIGVGRSDHGWIVCCIGGNRLERVRVPRHNATQERLGGAIDLFWEGVQRQAVPNWLADEATVCTLAALDVDDKAPAADLTDNEAVRRDLRRYLRWKPHLDFIDAQLKAMKARIGLAMLDRTKATCPDGSVTWPLVTRPAKQIPAKWQTEAQWRGGFTVRGPK